MKIECACGYPIHDHSDELAHKAHLVPYGWWLRLLEGLDDLIARGGRSARRDEAAAMHARTLVTRLTRRMWQCDRCGTLYVEDRERGLVGFAPLDAARARRLLAVNGR